MNQKRHTEELGTLPISRVPAKIAIPSSIALFAVSYLRASLRGLRAPASS